MATILTDRYSAMCAVDSLQVSPSDQDDLRRIDVSSLVVLQNLVLCDRLLIDSNSADSLGVTMLKKEMSNVVQFLDELKLETKSQRDAVSKFINKTKEEEEQMHFYGASYSPYDIYYDINKYNKYTYKGLKQTRKLLENEVDNEPKYQLFNNFLERSKQYLLLSKHLGVMLSLHPSRVRYLQTAIGYSHKMPVSEILIRRFEQTLEKAPALSYLGINLKIPAVAEHVLAVSRKKTISPLVAARDLRNSRHAKAFREKCSEIEHEIHYYGRRCAFRNMQKLLNEIDTLAKVWMEDCDAEVKYRLRTVPIASLWGIGKFFNSIGLKEITLKDPILYRTKPSLLFLNDLYRSPQKV